MRSVVEALVAIACALTFFYAGSYDAARLYSLANALATVSGVLFGFLLTAIAMISSLPERRLVQNMRITGHYRVLVRGTLRACGAHFFAMVVALVAIFSQGEIVALLVSISIALAAFAILRTMQAGRRFWIVLEALEGSD